MTVATMKALAESLRPNLSATTTAAAPSEAMCLATMQDGEEGYLTNIRPHSRTRQARSRQRDDIADEPALGVANSPTAGCHLKLASKLREETPHHGASSALTFLYQLRHIESLRRASGEESMISLYSGGGAGVQQVLTQGCAAACVRHALVCGAHPHAKPGALANAEIGQRPRRVEPRR